MDEKKRFYGKYRGIVKDNKDPERRGRLQAVVQDVLGYNDSGWALPCTPYAGEDVGLFLIPPIDSWVWIEFEQGNSDYPIWTGCFWAKAGDVPTEKLFYRGDPSIKILKTEFCTIILDDTQKYKGITIDTKISGEEMKIVMNTEGIKITASKEIQIEAERSAKIVLKSNKVSINGNALEVT